MTGTLQVRSESRSVNASPDGTSTLRRKD